MSEDKKYHIPANNCPIKALSLFYNQPLLKATNIIGIPSLFPRGGGVIVYNDAIFVIVIRVLPRSFKGKAYLWLIYPPDIHAVDFIFSRLGLSMNSKNRGTFIAYF